MFTLFNQPYPLNTRIRFHPTFDRVKDHVSANLRKVIDHHRRHVYTVPSDHLLVQLLQTLPIETDTDLNVLRSRVEDYTAELSRVFDLPSVYHTGKVLEPGPFLGETGGELVILSEESFPIADIRGQWEELSPVRFLSHPHADFNMPVPRGEKQGNGTGYSVIIVNLPMLALQYQMWRKRELRINPDFPRTTMHFIAQYVLPNALTSYVDVAWFNVVKAVFEKRPVPDSVDPHPFYFNSRHEETVEGIRANVNATLDQKVSFAEALELLVPLSANSLQEVIAIPAFPKTRQITPALVVARLPVVSLLVRWAAFYPQRHNRQALNRVSRSLRQLRSMNLSTYGSSELLDHVEATLEGEIKAFL